MRKHPAEVGGGVFVCGCVRELLYAPAPALIQPLPGCDLAPLAGERSLGAALSHTAIGPGGLNRRSAGRGGKDLQAPLPCGAASSCGETLKKI